MNKDETFKDISIMDETELGMTNYDYTIDEGLDDALRERPNEICAAYSGWNFCGYVWFNGENFTCQVWTYNTPREEIKADTLQDIMDAVSCEYGAD